MACSGDLSGLTCIVPDLMSCAVAADRVQCCRFLLECAGCTNMLTVEI